jgi:hypothetical protein
MTERDYQSWPADRVQGPLRPGEALIEILRAERVFNSDKLLAIDGYGCRKNAPIVGPILRAF